MSSAESQSALWAKGASDWAKVQEGTVSPLYQTVLARLQPKEGDHLLDIGCGAGLFCKMAAAQGVLVSGIDATEALIKIARRRTKSGDFRVGDMEELPFDEASFDFVTAFNSIQFAESPLNALRQARRMLKPEGVLAIAIWGGPQQAEAAVCLKALAALASPAPANAPGPFTLSGPEVLESVVTQAGFESFRKDEVDCLWSYPDLKTLAQGLLASGPGAAAKAEVGAAKARKALAAAAEPYKTAAGGYEFRNRFRYVLSRPRRRTATRD
ncbi:MAG: class I SAM-dependent methyltransferase [Steroidobacteraceae bacterium]